MLPTARLGLRALGAAAEGRVVCGSEAGLIGRRAGELRSDLAASAAGACAARHRRPQGAGPGAGSPPQAPRATVRIAPGQRGAQTLEQRDSDSLTASNSRPRLAATLRSPL